MVVHTCEGLPLRWIHGPHKYPYLGCEYGEKLGLGSRQYGLVDVLPAEQFARAMHAGKGYITPALAARLLVEMPTARPTAPVESDGLTDLTERERQVLELVEAAMLAPRGKTPSPPVSVVSVRKVVHGNPCDKAT